MAKKHFKGLSLLFALLMICSTSLLLTPAVGAVSANATPAFATSPSVPFPTDAEEDAARATLSAAVTKDIKDLRVHVGGVPFGVKFMTDGIFVVGFCDVRTASGTVNPASAAGLRLGDVIREANGKKLSCAAELTTLTEGCKGKSLSLVCSRGGKEFTVTLTPALSAEEGRYKTGLYVRDSGAGIGTVTFVLPRSGAFAGLGHGICDAESGNLIPMERGSVVNVTISGVVKGLPGSPGEVKGFFKSGKTGTLLGNTDCGVYGVLAELPDGINKKTVAVASREELKEGKAYLSCTLDDGVRRQYEVEISNIKRDSLTNKCFTVKVTDKELLAKTGGIIQGMSGSPIIQNGKLVGAVTHVLINDPTTGYGIFIENMLTQMGDLAA